MSANKSSVNPLDRGGDVDQAERKHEDEVKISENNKFSAEARESCESIYLIFIVYTSLLCFWERERRRPGAHLHLG
jgi:hypothetical protein